MQPGNVKLETSSRIYLHVRVELPLAEFRFWIILVELGFVEPTLQLAEGYQIVQQITRLCALLLAEGYQIVQQITRLWTNGITWYDRPGEKMTHVWTGEYQMIRQTTHVWAVEYQIVQ